MSWGNFKMAPAKRVKRCDMSTSKFTKIYAFFINVNKISIPAIVPEQSESASFVTLVEIYNVDVLAASNRDATVLSPTAGTLCSGQERLRLTSKLSLIQAPIHIHNRHVGPTVSSSFLVHQLKRQANHERLGCTLSSKFIFNTEY